MRKKLVQKRQSLSPAEQLAAAHSIFKKLLALPKFTEAKKIAVYLPINGEINTQKIIEYVWKNKKSLYLPVIQKNLSITFYSYCENDALIENHWGVLEPDKQTAETIEAKALDCVIVPCVGFDEKNNRLGMGVGCYDRTFAFRQSAKTKPTLIGVAHTVQKVNIKPNHWDVPLDFILSA